MTYAIFDHKAIGASLRKASSLKSEPNTVNAKVYVPPQFDEWGMFAGYDAGVAGCDYFWSAADGCYLPIIAE